MIDSNGKLLLDESPIIVLPTLAVVLGNVEQAIFLQQLHFWLMRYKDDPSHQRDGRVWIWNTYKDWLTQFRWISDATLRRIVKSLEESKMILTTSAYNSRRGDETKWYTIEYHNLEALLNSATPLLKLSNAPAQIEQPAPLKLSNAINTKTSQRIHPETTIITSDVDFRNANPDFDSFAASIWGRAWTMMGWAMKAELLRLTQDKQQLRQAMQIAAEAGENAKTVRFVRGVIKKMNEQIEQEKARYRVLTSGNNGSRKEETLWTAYCGKELPATQQWQHKQECEVCMKESKRIVSELVSQTLKELSLSH